MHKDTLYINWLSIKVGPEIRNASTEEPAGSQVQWHPTGSTIFIVSKDMAEIEIRVDREVTNVEYQQGLHDKEAGVCTESSIMIFFVIPTRPALVSGFDARSEAGNKIAIKFRLGTAENVELYSKLTKWLRQYGNIKSIKEISDVAWFWNLSRNPITDDDNMSITGALSVISLTDGDDENLDPGIITTTCGIQFPKYALKFFNAGRWANDDVLNAGLEWCLKHGDKNSRCHAFNTFFYTKLAEHGFEGVKKWASAYNLLEKETLFIPCNLENDHWVLGIIDDPGAATAESDDRTPKVYILDSLRSGSRVAVGIDLQGYLDGYARFQTKVTKKIKLASIYNVPVPQQPNGSECGYYVIHFTKIFLESPSKCREFIASNLTSDVLANEVWSGKTAMNLRTTFRSYIESCIDS